MYVLNLKLKCTVDKCGEGLGGPSFRQHSGEQQYQMSLSSTNIKRKNKTESAVCFVLGVHGM